MSLNYHLDAIADYKATCYEPAGTDTDGEPLVRIKSATETLIWATMAVDLGEITAENAAEWLYRLAASDFVRTPKRAATLDELQDLIEAHIGLRTNVRNLTRAQWKAKQLRIAKEERERELARWARATADHLAAKLTQQSA